MTRIDSLPRSARHEPSPTPAPAAALKLSVVVPVFNEAGTLGEVIRRIRAVPIPKEIILVDDGSTDGTRDVLAAWEGLEDIRVLRQERNRGKGAAVRAAFAQVRGDVVVIQDADLEYDPADYQRLIRPILEGKADVVFGSRMRSTQDRRAFGPWQYLGNRVLTAFSNLFTRLRLTDMETCYKAFRREVVEDIAPTLEQDHFGIEPEITAKVARRRYRVCEVPIRYVGRTYEGGKKIGWRDAVEALRCILRYRREDSRSAWRRRSP